jgi:hypothetical protein
MFDLMLACMRLRFAKHVLEAAAGHGQRPAIGRGAGEADPMAAERPQRLVHAHAEPGRDRLEERQAVAVAVVVDSDEVLIRQRPRRRQRLPLRLAEARDGHVAGGLMDHAVQGPSSCRDRPATFAKARIECGTRIGDALRSAGIVFEWLNNA